MKHLILATAGHVDHGKTSLIKALTGTDTDRLPEEKARGITIELGFAHLELDDVSLGIVDVPGHEDFVKNMVAGVGSIDFALLVVAADDGWMPQTEEHLQILEYLGVTRAVVAITKSDLGAPPSDVIRTQLAGTSLADAPILPVSVKNGVGLDGLRAQLAEECRAIAAQTDLGKPRLAVDRAFNLRGIGTVVTGTLSGGKLRRGDAVVVQPSGKVGRIRAIQSHGHEVDVSEPGMRTALSIPGVEVSRGDVITLPNTGGATTIIDVLVTRSPRLASDTRPLKNAAIIRVHHGTASSSARIFFANENPLRAGESAIAELRFDAQVFAFAGDRLVLRDPSLQQTVGGALVLDPDAAARDFRSSAQQELLNARAKVPGDAPSFVRTQLRRDHALRRDALLLKSRFSAAEVHAASSPAVIAGEFVCDREWWRGLRAEAASLIDAEHGSHPNRAGLALPQLWSALRPALPDEELFDALVADMCGDGFVRSNETIARTTHRPSLPASLQPAGARLRAALTAKPFDPPSRKELGPDAATQQALRFLRDTGEIVEISADVIVSREALDEMEKKVAAALQTNGGATVSELRQILGSSRRVVVPLLEYLDRAGMTRRVGDKRVLASAS